jgi:hypothetical protein
MKYLKQSFTYRYKRNDDSLGVITEYESVPYNEALGISVNENLKKRMEEHPESSLTIKICG